MISSKFLSKIKIPKNAIAVILILLFVLSLIPIIIAAFYSFPTFDDYNFGFYSHKSIIEGNSFFAGVIESCTHFYNNWQGFFTTNFIASVQPFVWNENLYFISNLAVIFAFTFSVFYFSKSILINSLGFDSIDYILITIPIYEIILQFLPSLAEGFYWMDGSLTLLGNSVMLLILSFVINFHNANTKLKKVVYFALSVIFTLSICGSSIITYVTLFMIFFFATIYLFRNKRDNKKTLLLIGTLFLIYTIGIIIALIAPGNSVRMQSDFSNNRLSFISAIMKAIFFSFVYIGRWSTLCFITILIFISIVFYKHAVSLKYSFKNPLLVFIICYGVYAGRMSVQLYSGGYLGSPRQMNQYFLAFVLTMTISWLYFVGWIAKKGYFSLQASKNYHNGISMITLLVLVFLFGAGLLGFGVKKVSTVSVGLSLYTGELQTYKSEMDERLKIYNDETITNVVVKPLTVYPSCYMADNITDDKEYWTNRSVAEYYSKNIVVLE